VESGQVNAVLLPNEAFRVKLWRHGNEGYDPANGIDLTYSQELGTLVASVGA
jgi:hypothetical protein